MDQERSMLVSLLSPPEVDEETLSVFSHWCAGLSTLAVLDQKDHQEICLRQIQAYPLIFPSLQYEKSYLHHNKKNPAILMNSSDCHNITYPVNYDGMEKITDSKKEKGENNNRSDRSDKESKESINAVYNEQLNHAQAEQDEIDFHLKNSELTIDTRQEACISKSSQSQVSHYSSNSKEEHDQKLASQLAILAQEPALFNKYGPISNKINDMFRMFRVLEPYLQSPKLLHTQTIAEVPPHRHHFLIETYWELHDSVVREILIRKNFVSRSRKDLEEISENTKLPLRNVMRQFHNIKRLHTAVDDEVEEDFSLYYFVKDKYLLPSDMCWTYACILFIFYSKFNVSTLIGRYNQPSSATNSMKDAHHVKSKQSRDSYDNNNNNNNYNNNHNGSSEMKGQVSCHHILNVASIIYTCLICPANIFYRYVTPASTASMNMNGYPTEHIQENGNMIPNLNSESNENYLSSAYSSQYGQSSSSYYYHLDSAKSSFRYESSSRLQSRKESETYDMDTLPKMLPPSTNSTNSNTTDRTGKDGAEGQECENEQDRKEGEGEVEGEGEGDSNGNKTSTDSKYEVGQMNVPESIHTPISKTVPGTIVEVHSTDETLVVGGSLGGLGSADSFKSHTTSVHNMKRSSPLTTGGAAYSYNNNHEGHDGYIRLQREHYASTINDTSIYIEKPLDLNAIMVGQDVNIPISFLHGDDYECWKAIQGVFIHVEYFDPDKALLNNLRDIRNTMTGKCVQYRSNHLLPSPSCHHVLFTFI